MRRLNLEGQRHERLAIVGPHTSGRWLVRCECGAEKLMTASGFLRDKSCGCFIREKLSARNRRHGEAARGKKTAEYLIWVAMNRRCHDANHKDYPYYGGRGIFVCDRWRHSYSNFLSDVGRRPAKGYSIDRVKNDVGYEPGNVEWATHSQQMLNRRPFKRKTHCCHGHEFTHENTYLVKSTGDRRCRECDRASDQRRKARKYFGAPSPQVTK